MKRILVLILALLMVLSVLCVSAEREVTVLIDGERLVSDVRPMLVNGRTMLPMRAIFEAFDANVTWMGEDELVFATKDDILVVLKIGAKEMSVQTVGNNENKVIVLDAAPFLHKERTMVPARAVAEALGADVDWIDETSTVIITKKQQQGS